MALPSQRSVYKSDHDKTERKGFGTRGRARKPKVQAWQGRQQGLPSKDIEVAVQNTNKACCTLNSQQRVRAAGLTGDVRHQAHKNELANMDNIICPTTVGRGVHRDTPAQLTLTSREPSITLTNGQGIPDQLDSSLELYDGITCIIRVALEDNMHADPEKSMLAKTGIKLAHPETYVGGSDLEEFEVFVAGILRWLKMNNLLGPTNRHAGQLPRHLPDW